MKAIIEGIEVFDVTILGRWEGQGRMVEWSAPSNNVNAKRLLEVQQAGFAFHIRGGTCYIISRQYLTTFIED